MSTEQFLLNQRLHSVQQHLMGTLKTLEQQSKKTVRISQQAQSDKERVKELCLMLKNAIRKASATDLSLSKREEQIRDLNSLLETRLKEIHDLEFKLTQSTQRENEMRQQIEQTQSVIESVNVNLKDMQQRYELHQRHLKEKYELEHQKVLELEQQLETNRRDLEAVNDAQSRTKDEYAERTQNAEQQRTAIEEKLKNEQSAHEESRRFLEGQIRILGEQMDHIRDQKLTAESAVDKLRKDLQEQIDRHAERYNELMKEHAADKERANRAHMDEIKRLHEQIVSLSTDFSAKLADERTKCALLQKEVYESQRQGTSNLEKLRSEVVEREQQLRNTIDELKSKLGHCEQEVDAAKQTADAARLSADASRQSESRLREENDAYKTQHESHIRRIEELSTTAGSHEMQRIVNEERLSSTMDFISRVQEKRNNEKVLYKSFLRWSVWCTREKLDKEKRRVIEQQREGSSQTDAVLFTDDVPQVVREDASSQTVAQGVRDRKTQTVVVQEDVPVQPAMTGAVEAPVAQSATPITQTTQSPPKPQVIVNTNPEVQPAQQHVPSETNPLPVETTQPIETTKPASTTTAPQLKTPPATESHQEIISTQQSPRQTLRDISKRIEEQGREIQSAVNEFDQLLEEDMSLPELDLSQFRLPLIRGHSPKLTKSLEIIEETIYGSILTHEDGNAPTAQKRHEERISYEYKSPSK